MQETTYQDLNEYRLAWVSPDDVSKINRGAFLFSSPDEAKTAIAEMEALFPTYAIWLEDKDKNITVFE